MKKNILIVLLIIVVGFLLYQPTFDIFDLVKIRRHQISAEPLNCVERYYYDLNNDGEINDKDLEIMRAYILHE